MRPGAGLTGQSWQDARLGLALEVAWLLEAPCILCPTVPTSALGRSRSGAGSKVSLLKGLDDFGPP